MHISQNMSATPAMIAGIIKNTSTLKQRATAATQPHKRTHCENFVALSSNQTAHAIQSTLQAATMRADEHAAANDTSKGSKVSAATATPSPTTTTITTKTSLWRSGDYAKLIVSALVLTFLGCICAHELGYVSFFSKSYREDGFCVSNPGAHPMVQGHAISFYADAITAALMLGLVHVGRTRLGMSEPSLRPIDKNAFSLFGHGCGHLYLAFQTSKSSGQGGASQVFENLTASGQAFAFVSFMFVWYVRAPVPSHIHMHRGIFLGCQLERHGVIKGSKRTGTPRPTSCAPSLVGSKLPTLPRLC